MIIQALFCCRRSIPHRIVDTVFNLHSAASYLVNPAQEINSFPYGFTGCKGAKVFRIILDDFPAHCYPRKIIPQSDLDIRISLVILEHGIVLGLIFLDKVILKDKSLKLRVRYNVFKPCNVLDHLLYLDALFGACTEIRPYAVTQDHSFPNIDNDIILVVHHVDTRTFRKFIQFFIYIKICSVHTLYIITLSAQTNSNLSIKRALRSRFRGKGGLPHNNGSIKNQLIPLCFSLRTVVYDLKYNCRKKNYAFNNLLPVRVNTHD